MTSTILKLGGAALFAVAAGSVQAASITVLNPSFEAPSYVGAAPLWGAAAGWVNVNAGTYAAPAASFTVIPDGVQVGFANGGSLQQTLSGETMVAGNTYTLSVQVGDRKETGTNIQSYTVALTVGGVVVASDINLLNPADDAFLESIVTYTALGTETGDIGITLSSTGAQTNFDDVQLSSVPLPAAAWLFGSALLGLVTVARRKATSVTA